MVAPRGVDYQYTSCNILAFLMWPTPSHAIKKLVFEKKMYTLQEIQDATETNWEGREPMRLRFLNQDKYGNDLDEVDGMFVRITETLADIMDQTLNMRGQQLRASLFHFQGQTARALLGRPPMVDWPKSTSTWHQSSARKEQQRSIAHGEFDGQGGPKKIPGRILAGRDAAQVL